MRRIATVAALFMVTACSQEREVASGTVTDPDTGETSTYAVAKKDGDTVMKVKTSEGEARITTGADVALPLGFPAYPGAQTKDGMTVSGTGAGGIGGMTIFETRDPPEKVIAFYRAAAARAGRKIETEVTTGDMRMIGSAGGDTGEGFQLMVRREGDMTQATLIGGSQAGK